MSCGSKIANWWCKAAHSNYWWVPFVVTFDDGRTEHRVNCKRCGRQWTDEIN